MLGAPLDLDGELGPLAGGRGAFAVDNELTTAVRLLPREVVVVLDRGQRLGSQVLDDAAVDDLVVGRGVAAHEVHRVPVLLALLGVQVEPGEVRRIGSCLLTKRRD